MIAKADGKRKVAKLETLTENMSFRQGNKFALSVLISMMLVVEKEEVNWAIWFSQKLQNEIIVIQCKAGKIGNTLTRSTLTIIGHHFLKQWELEKKESIGTRKKTQNKNEKMIVDVSAILLVEKKKSKLVITTSKEIIEVSPIQEGNLGEVDEASSILSEIGGKHVEILNEVMAKPLVPIIEEVETQLVEKKGMQNVPIDVDMEELRIHEVVSEEVITKGEDHKYQYLEHKDVEIIAIKEPFHQQLEKELLMQPKEDE